MIDLFFPLLLITAFPPGGAPAYSPRPPWFCSKSHASIANCLFHWRWRTRINLTHPFPVRIPAGSPPSSPTTRVVPICLSPFFFFCVIFPLIPRRRFDGDFTSSLLLSLRRRRDPYNSGVSSRPSLSVFRLDDPVFCTFFLACRTLFRSNLEVPIRESTILTDPAFIDLKVRFC